MYKILGESTWVYKFLTTFKTDFKIENVNSPTTSTTTSSSSKRKRDTTFFDNESWHKRPKNDVFLNYSFEDTGNGIVSHLKGALSRNGFTMSDHTMLPVCEDESSELSKAIEESGIYLVILSKGYASSNHCLDELVRIMDCLTRHEKRKVFPVFYKIEPTDVKGQKGPGFHEAFQAHEADVDVDSEMLLKWKRALDYVAEKAGEPLLDGDEEKFTRKIVKELIKMQNPIKLFHVECPVGIESRAGEIISALRLNDHVFNIVTVVGISGSGKTTIVKAVYDKIVTDFEYRCFIEDVYSYEDRWGRRWKFELQKDVISCLTRNAESATISTHNDEIAKIMKLIMGRKVLWVLDGVDTFEHLEALGLSLHHAPFSCSSRIIITTKNKSLADLPHTTPYNMRLLDARESFELFAGLAFKKDDHVDEKFVEQILRCAGGLPLVVKIWSRLFKRCERKNWPRLLETLIRIPDKNIQKKLEMSYDSLSNRAKKLFLDIACFFYGMEMDLVMQVLQDELPVFEIQQLLDTGLVEIHSLVSPSTDFSKNKIFFPWLNRPSKEMWQEYYILEMHRAIREMGAEIVRQENEDEPGRRTRLIDERDVALVLEDCSGTELVESITWIKEGEEVTHVQVEALRDMMNLRLINLNGYSLAWDDYSYDEMSPLSFKKLKYMEWSYFPFKSLDAIEMANVVVLNLRNSKLEILCERIKNLKKLRILDVRLSASLTRTGNFVGLENLEELYLEDCDQLEELHGSVSQLHKLREIMLNGCAKLESIPNLPTNIEVIKANNCKGLVNLPHSIGQLHTLREIELDGCDKLESIPNLPPSIEVIHACNTSLVNLPDSIDQVFKLREIMLDGCTKLGSIPNLPHNIETIYARDCTSLVNLPSNMSELQRLENLVLGGCFKLELESFKKVSRPRNLCSLWLRNCNVSQVSSEIGSMESLQYLDLSENTFSSLPESFSNLSKLEELAIRNCSQLQLLPLLPSEISCIDASGCWSLDVMPYDIKQKAYIFRSELFKESFFTGGLLMSLSGEELPDWCSLQNRGDVLAIEAPVKLDKKICGVIICATIKWDFTVSSATCPIIINRTNNTSHEFESDKFYGCPMPVMIYSLDDTTLVVEAGDNVELQFFDAEYHSILSCGLSFIYEGDFLDSTLLVQKVPA